jgi:hypothetical protein
LPRVLTQIDRDPTSSTFGCCDRNWWHYKIRDFPSIILQQAGYAAHVCAAWPLWTADREGLQHLAAASAAFWSRHVAAQQSFDEYYPFEKGYPPLAFSTLAVMKLVDAGVVPRDAVKPGAQLAAKLLQHRFEAKAANQQMAGAAALLWVGRIFPERVDPAHVKRVVDSTLALQTREGWFWEYDGPDLGYLSVTIDCLWDAWDATADQRFLDAAVQAMHYIEVMTRLGGTNIGMHNARNTDYIVPYGLVRLALTENLPDADVAQRLVERLFTPQPNRPHFFYPTDDRYICHYIGASVFRAGALLSANPEPREPSPPATLSETIVFQEAGHVLTSKALVSLKKGGVITLFHAEGGQATDFGWGFTERNRRYVSHWWSGAWKINQTEQGWQVSGPLVPCRELISSPIKHIALRIMSRLFGAAIIGRLKKIMIFRRHASAFQFQRDIVWTPTGVKLIDTITPPPTHAPQPAPRASRRHVASADSFHPEDFAPVASSWQVTRQVSKDDQRWKVETTYSVKTTH